MRMLKYSLFTVMLLLSIQCVTLQDCPTEEDAISNDVLVTNLGDEEIYIRKTADIAELEKDLTPNELDALSLEAIAEQAARIPAEILSVGDEDPGDAASLDIAVPYYYRTCPHKWYVLWKYKWYWRVLSIQKDGTKIIEYCFSPWWVWGTYCGNKHCHWSYWPFTWFDARYKCYPEHRLVRHPMLCYKRTIAPDGTVISSTWLNWKWKHIWVPRGCCCRKYWWFQIKSATCPADQPKG